ncbi:MAG TPA: hypothetical protein PKC98_10930, partial [Candidatus Melainabacteria bacterium]|nr:hypothetical protein [Candidatus Melainabacteria bacterium]
LLPVRLSWASLSARRTVSYNTRAHPGGAGGESVQEQNPKIGDRYLRLDQIGQGAVGTVHLCHDPVMDNRVAIKMLSGDASGQALSAGSKSDCQAQSS